MARGIILRHFTSQQWQCSLTLLSIVLHCVLLRRQTSVICSAPTSQHTHLTTSTLIKRVLVYKTRATGLNRINLSVQRLSVETGAKSPFSRSDSYDVAGRVRDCALSSFVEPFARRNAVSSAANGAWNGKRPSSDNPPPYDPPLLPLTCANEISLCWVNFVRLNPSVDPLCAWYVQIGEPKFTVDYFSFSFSK